MPEADDRETTEVPADWRRSAFGVLMGVVGLAFALTGADGGVTPSTAMFGGGLLLVGWAMGLTDHVVEREQERLTARLRNKLGRDRDSRA